MKTVIMAGGKGTRISSVAYDIPKPMIPVCGKPVLEWEIECLRDYGFTDIIMTVSHYAKIIMDYFGDGSVNSPTTGKPFGVHIMYYYEKEPLGNAGALFRLKNILPDGDEDNFLLLNADAIFNIDFHRLVASHKKYGGLVTLFTHPNSHPYDSGLIVANEEKIVLRWLSKEEERPEYYRNRVNAGVHVVSVKVLEQYITNLTKEQKREWNPKEEGINDVNYGNPIIPINKIDLDRKLLKPLSGTGQMFVYDSPEYVKDMGTPERYNSVCKDYEDGIVQAKNLSNIQKAIFLDRDGIINKYVGFLRNIADFELLQDVSEAIKLINASGYLAIVVTNQPVIARGEVTFDELEQIHNKMETLLGLGGAYLDGIYYCPHHPHKGYEGEVSELKIECNCRKPKPGMLLQAAKDFNIDLKQSWMIGDSENDLLAGKYAGCMTGLVKRNTENIPSARDAEGYSLFKVVKKILGEQ